MSTPKFTKTHNLVAFLKKPEESNGFEEIIDFLNASSIQYALTVNPTIYTTCIEQFWTSAKAKTVNGERQIQALVDKKKEIIIETSIRNDLKLDDAEGTYCLPTTTIFEELERMGEKVLDLEKARTAQAKDIASLKKRVKQLEKRRNSRTLGLKRLRKEATSKHGRKIGDLDADTEVTLIDETQERNDDDLMFDTDILNDDKVFEEPMAFAATTTRSIPITTATSVEIPDELTLAQTLIEIKSTKPKAVTTDATTVTHVFTRPKAKWIVFHDQDKQAPASKPIISPAQPSSKDKEQAKLERMQRERVEQEEASRAAVIEELDSIQAMVEADEQLAARLQAKEQEQFSIKEKSRMLVEMIAERKRDDLEYDNSKKHKLDEHVEAKGDDDQDEEEMKKHMEIVQDKEVAIDAIPLATKPPVIVEYKIVKEGKIGHFQLI
ncbi:hypothetical protein Tco_0299956 [Tanacetum coccineum]